MVRKMFWWPSRQASKIPNPYLLFSADDGMSMIEILIGVVILSLVLIPSMNVLSSGTQTVLSTRDHEQATFFAQQILEKLRSYPFEYLDKDRFPANSAESKKTFEYEMEKDQNKNTRKINEIIYSVKSFKIIEVQHKADLNVQPSLALVSFFIEYTTKDGKPHSVEFNTAVSQQE
ncbi:hypothetical protein HYY75_06350 [bacterium]|nr:hypothetical protein [bacterium]